MILRFPKYLLWSACVGVFYKIVFKLFIKKRLQHRYLTVHFVKFFGRALCYSTPVVPFELTLSYTCHIPYYTWLMTSSHSNYALCCTRVSIITTLRLRTIRYKRMSLINDFHFVFVFESVYFIYCCSIPNTVISLLVHKLH